MRRAVPKPLVPKPTQLAASGKASKRKTLTCPSSEAIVVAVLFVCTAVLLLAVTRAVLSRHQAVTVLTAKTLLSGAVLLLQNVFCGGELLGPLALDDALWWQAVASLHVVAKLTLMVGLQSVSFSVVCAFACLAALGHGFASKATEGGSPESVVVGAGVVAGIVVLGLQDGARFSGLVYGALTASAVASWGYVYLLRTSSPTILTRSLPERCSAAATTEFYVACGGLPIVAGLFWCIGAEGRGSSWPGSFFVPFTELSVTDKMLFLVLVLLEQLKTRLGSRVMQKASTRFFVGAELVSYVLVLVLGGGGARGATHEAGTVVGLIAVLGTTMFAIVFIPRDAQQQKKPLKLAAQLVGGGLGGGPSLVGGIGGGGGGMHDSHSAANPNPLSSS